MFVGIWTSYFVNGARTNFALVWLISRRGCPFHGRVTRCAQARARCPRRRLISMSRSNDITSVKSNGPLGDVANWVVTLRFQKKRHSWSMCRWRRQWRFTAVSLCTGTENDMFLLSCRWLVDCQFGTLMNNVLSFLGKWPVHTLKSLP